MANQEERKKRIRKQESIWTNEETINLISAIEQCPFLWDDHLEEYKDRNKKRSALIEIGQILNKTPQEIWLKWQNLRVTFCCKLRKMQEKKINPRWEYFKCMSFLQKRKTLLTAPSSTNSMENDKGTKNWTYHEGKALISVYENRKEEYYTCQNKIIFWENCLADLEALNVLTSPTSALQVKNKWKTLVRAYHSVRDKQGTGPTAATKFLYMAEMDAIFNDNTDCAFEENFETDSMNVNFNNSAVKSSEQNENSHQIRRLTQQSHVVLNEGQVGCRSSRYDSSSSLSTGGLPSSFCKVELNAPIMQQKQQQRQKQKNYQHISDSSNYSELSSSLPRSESQMTAKTRANTKESSMLSQKKNLIPVDLPSRNIPIPSSSKRNQEYTEREMNTEFYNERDNVTSHDVLINACSPLTINKANNDIYQNDMQSSKWDNLRSFGNFIDAELQRLDENSLAIAKMKIHKILHEASLGMYKNGDHKTDSIDEEESSVIETEVNVNTVNDGEPEAQFSNNRKRLRESSCENKENQGPFRLSSHEQNPGNYGSNNLDSQQVNRVRKKRHKTKDILSAIYDTLKTGNMTNAESRISFGSYVSNELRSMDNETIKNAKLSICRVLFEASIGKYKKVIENDLNVNLQVQDNDVILQSEESSKANNSKMELITPKMEIIDTNYEL